MTDTVLANAHRKRDSLAAEINSLAQRTDELKRELAKIDAWIAQWHEFAVVGEIAATEVVDSASMSVSVASFQPGTDGKAEPKRRRAAGNPKKEDVAEAARQIIQKRGEPVSRTDLFKALAERGVVISSETDPEMVLSTMLWRMQDRVVRLKGGGYWLADAPYAPANYTPGAKIEYDDEAIDMENAAQDGDLPIVDEEMEREAADAHRRARWGDFS